MQSNTERAKRALDDDGWLFKVFEADENCLIKYVFKPITHKNGHFGQSAHIYFMAQ